MIEVIDHIEGNVPPNMHGTKVREAQYQELERRIYTVLKSYANVHRGAGHHSRVTTALYEYAREVVLEHFGLKGCGYTVVFGSKWGLEAVRRHVKNKCCIRHVFSNDIGLPLGIGALVVPKNAAYTRPVLPSGGGTVRLVSRNVLIWGTVPAIGEAGTPNIVGAIALAVALQMIEDTGDKDLFRHKTAMGSGKNLLYNDDFRGATGAGLLSKLRDTLIGGGLPVPTSCGWIPNTYLDNAASTPTFEVVWDVARSTLRLQNRGLEDIIDGVKDICARFFNAPKSRYDVLFTQNTTEGINIVAEQMRRNALRDGSSRHLVLNTLLEHNSNEIPWRSIPPVSVLRMGVERDGIVDLHRMEEILCDFNHRRMHGNKRIKLVAVSGCSNVLGSLSDIEGIGGLARRYGARFLVDAAQLAAHRPVDVGTANIDYLVFSGHKMYAPFGAGGLIVRRGLFDLDASLLDEVVDSGKANIAGIAAMGKAMELLDRIGLARVSDTEGRLVKRAVEGLRHIPDVQVFGYSQRTREKDSSTGPIVAFSMGKIHHNLVAKLFAERGGISVRNGCLCAHLLVKHLLRVSFLQRFLSNLSMLLFPRITKEFLPGIVRMSIGMENTVEEIEHFLHTLREIAAEHQPLFGRIFARLHYGTPVLPATEEERMMEEYVSDMVERVYSFRHAANISTRCGPGK